MRRRCKETGKKRPCAALIISAVLLTGCAQATAGEAPDLAQSSAGEEAYVSFFDGDVVKGAETRITGGIPSWEMERVPDTSMIPMDDVCTLICYKVQMSDPDIRPVQAAMPNGKTLEYMGRKYDGAGYPLGEGWYGFLIPNGLDEYAIRIGNTLFMVQED